MSDIKIGFLTKKDNLNQIVNLFNTIYPKRPIKKDYVLWRYIENPFQSVTSVLKDQDKIIGMYSSCIFEGYIKGNKAKIGFMYDLMIHPAYQGRGLVIPLYDALLKSVKKSKPALIYSFTNSISLPLYTKYFKWSFKRKVYLYFSKTRGLKNLLADKITLYHKIFYKEHLQESIENLTLKSFKDAAIQNFILRSQKLIQWRSTKVFGKDFKLFIFYQDENLIGYCLLKFFKDKTDNKTTADIIDFVIYPKEYFNDALYIICKLIEKKGIKNIATFGFGQINERSLKKLGFERSDINWNLMLLSPKNDSDLYVNMLEAEMF